MAIEKVGFTLDGERYSLKYNSSTGTWQTTITAPGTSFHRDYYPCTVDATNTQDASTTVDIHDSKVGERLKLVVREDEAPTVTVLQTHDKDKSVVSQPEIHFILQEERGGSGLDTSSVRVIINDTEYAGIELLNIGEYYFGKFEPPFLPNGLYEISVSALDNDKNIGIKTVSIEIFNFSTVAKTDWTELDYYNYWDLSRVQKATQFLSEVLYKLGYWSAWYQSRGSDWSHGEIPTQSEMSQYLTNVKELKRVFLVLPTTPELPESMENLNAQDAIDIEQNLLDMYLLVELMRKRRFYSGEIYLGEI